MQRVKKNDKVVVLTGKDKGKTGVVFMVLPKKGKIKVKGIALATHHRKAKKQGETSAIRQEESFIEISNVMPISPDTGKPCRVCKMKRG